MSLKRTLDQYLDNEDVEKFALWAFGNGFKKELGSINFMKRWNVLHSDLLELKSSGLLIDDIKKMIDIWKSI